MPVKWSSFIKDFGSATAATISAWRSLGFALSSEVPGAARIAANTPVVITGNHALAPGDYVLADTSSGGFTLTLPANPSPGDEVRTLGVGWATNNLTIARNGQTIKGASEDLLCIFDDTLILVFVGGTWSY